MSAEYIKTLLKRYSLRPNFTYGQNFLADEMVLEDILDAADIHPQDQILEIGPGIGTLTEKLCQRAGFVLSIEKDPKFLPILKSIKKRHKNFRYEIADALAFDFQKTLNNKESDTEKSRKDFRAFPREVPISSAAYKVVANIPYYITGKILQMLLSAKNKPASVIILTQKEVAENIIAAPGDLSVPAISVQLFGKPDILQIVPAKSFYPAPRVDSAVLRITPHKKPPYEISDEKKFFKVVKACFAGKRKQIHNTLRNNLKLTREQVDGILSAAKINPTARPQELGIGQWIELMEKISNIKFINFKSNPKLKFKMSNTQT